MAKLSNLFENLKKLSNYFICKKYFALFFTLLVIQPSFAQQISLKGKVLEEKTNTSIIGATIKLKGQPGGTATDVNGNFSLDVKSLPVTLFISSIGYKNQEIDVYEAVPTTIYLTENLNLLNSVVVVGYGTQKKSNLTGSVSTVDTKFIENKPFTNASQALQGVSGLYVNQEGGQPGNDVSTIRIRGVGTLNDNNPLVLVNGIEYSLKDVNPEDIESISVLKDASASIYGSRASNGVILVTTKRGNKGKAQLEYNGSLGWEKATYLPDVVTNSADWMTSRNQTSINEGQPVVFSDEDIEAFRTGTDADLYPNTDWYDIMFRTAKVQNHNFRVSGGDDKVK
ncbi:MAG: TonB-dependent receptor plug domain-containing protein, partial [Bacteroidales bacterium]